MDIVYDGAPATAFAFNVGLDVVALRGTAPGEWCDQFNRTMSGKGKASLSTATTPQDVYDGLAAATPPRTVVAPPGPGGGPPGGLAPPTTKDAIARAKKSKGGAAAKIAKADVVSLGDEFLAPAIQNGLVVPLPDDVANAEWYARLPAVWRALACRDAYGRPAPPPPPGSHHRAPGANADGSGSTEATNGRYGKIYGVPYRWGCYLIAYRKDKIPRGLPPPTDWPDLFRPQYAKKVGIASGSRFMLTVALRAGGRSANAADVDDATRNRLYDLRTTQLATQVDVDALQGEEELSRRLGPLSDRPAARTLPARRRRPHVLTRGTTDHQ
jgi:hypothetical protein